MNRTNRSVLLAVLRRGGSVLADLAYGINAGNAIRHGLPVPPRCERRFLARHRPDLGGTGVATRPLKECCDAR